MILSSTTDYNQFKKFILNRDLQKRNLDNLRSSVKEKNLLEYNPIIVSHDFLVIDGQHRLEIAKELNLPISYYILPEMSNEDLVQVLIAFNYSMSKWGPQQFLHLYTYAKYPEYLKFQKFMDDFNLCNINLALPISQRKRRKGGLSEYFRRGEYQFNDIEKIYEITGNAIQFLNLGREISLISKPNNHHNRFYFFAYAKLMEKEGFDQLKMLSNLKSYGINLINSPQQSFYFNQLHSLYIKTVKKEDFYEIREKESHVCKYIVTRNSDNISKVA